MSNWQSFFNVMENRNNRNRPLNRTNKRSQCLCRCQTGSIILNANGDIDFTGSCNITNACASIQIDKYKSTYNWTPLSTSVHNYGHTLIASEDTLDKKAQLEKFFSW